MFSFFKQKSKSSRTLVLTKVRTMSSSPLAEAMGWEDPPKQYNLWQDESTGDLYKVERVETKSFDQVVDELKGNKQSLENE